MEKKQTNYQLYERLGFLLQAKKPWSKDYIKLIQKLEPEPDYPVDDPLIVDLITFAINQIRDINPNITKKIGIIDHILEINFQTYDRFHYDLLSTYLYDLSEHLQGQHETRLPEDDLNKAKTKAISRLVESLAAICANNAQIL